MKKARDQSEQSLVLKDSEKKLISRRIRSCRIELLFPSIPKQITTSGEKYILRCLELIYDYASKGTSSFNSSKPDVSNMPSFLVKYPIASRVDWKIGSMQKILNSSLLKQFSSDYIASSSPPPRLRFRCSFSGEIGMIGVEGTLQCTWKNGVPNHVFSVENTKEVYTASFAKPESSKFKDLECVYTFYARKTNDDSSNRETIATMLVFTSITLCSSMEEQIKESKFILYVDQNNTKFTRKTGNLFRSGQLLKQLSISRASGKNASLLESSEKNDLLRHENAAIVIREIFYKPLVSVGGWGIKFLKKSCENKRNINGECSLTNMNVLIPAGVHGVVEDDSGGHSTLIERWVSGGNCDCGGWDMGCPLMVLEASKRSLDCTEKCNGVHLFIKESRQNAAVLKMTSIRDGFYRMEYESRLSNLQSFAIAVAVIHSQNP